MVKEPKSDSLPLESWKKILSVNELCYLLGYKTKDVKALAKNFRQYYYENPKVIKGKKRDFECTKGKFNTIQKKIDKLLLKYPFPKYMMGISRGKSIIDNAEVHLGSKILVTIDIKDCFPNTSDSRVFNMFRNQLGYSTKVASLLTRLTTYNHRVPQGTHSSSVVVGLCLLPLCQDIQKTCLSKNLNFSIWADDIAISGKNAELFIGDCINLLMKHGFACRNRKVRVWRGGKIKIVTGVGVQNNRLTVSNDRVEECMKIIINIAKSHGESKGKELRPLKGKIDFIQKIDKKKTNKIITFAGKLGVGLI